MRADAGTTRLRKRRQYATGSSLIELLIVLAMTGFISAGIYSFFLTTSRTYNDEGVQARLLTTASNASARIAQDIRAAGTIFSTPCALSLLVSASNAASGTITIRTILDDPSVRIEVAPNPPAAGQSQSNAVLGVLSTAGFQVGDLAFITDGVQCTRFTVTAIAGGPPPGLQHVPANDVNSAGGLAYVYPATTSLVYRITTNRQITYAIDTTTATRPWLTRNSGAGAVRLVPDIESMSFNYLMNDGTTVTDPTTITTAAQAANIRVVYVKVTAKADTRSLTIGGDGYRRQTIASAIRFRNLGSYLGP